MPPTILSSPPSAFTRNAQVSWTARFSDFDPSTDTLTLVFAKSDDQQSVEATDNGDGAFLITVDASASGAFKAGTYAVRASITSGGIRYQLDGQAGNPDYRFNVAVQEDFATQLSGIDARTHAATMVEAIEALLEGKATKDQMSYSVGDRSISRIPIPELIQLKEYYERQLNDEQQAEDIRLAKGGKGKLLVRM